MSYVTETRGREAEKKSFLALSAGANGSNEPSPCAMCNTRVHVHTPDRRCTHVHTVDIVGGRSVDMENESPGPANPGRNGKARPGGTPPGRPPKFETRGGEGVVRDCACIRFFQDASSLNEVAVRRPGEGNGRAAAVFNDRLMPAGWPHSSKTSRAHTQRS